MSKKITGFCSMRSALGSRLSSSGAATEEGGADWDLTV
jgi:hypothetical protein